MKLSDGTKVTFKQDWTHGMQKAFDLAIFQESDQITAKGLYRAWEVTFPMVIASVEKNGNPVEYTTEWLEALPEKDYKLLRTEADKLAAADGEKK